MENLLPEIVPGLVAIEAKEDNKASGEKKGAVKNVYPIDAKELLATGKYKLVENGAVEAARLNANPLRSSQRNIDTSLVVTEVTGIGGQVHVAVDEQTAEQLREASDHDGKAAPAADKLASGDTAPARAVETKAPGNPTGLKPNDDKR